MIREKKTFVTGLRFFNLFGVFSFFSFTQPWSAGKAIKKSISWKLCVKLSLTLFFLSHSNFNSIAFSLLDVFLRILRNEHRKFFLVSHAQQQFDKTRDSLDEKNVNHKWKIFAFTFFSVKNSFVFCFHNKCVNFHICYRTWILRSLSGSRTSHLRWFCHRDNFDRRHKSFESKSTQLKYRSYQ